MTRIIIATRNAHKTREFAQLLGADFTVHDLIDDETIPEVVEDGDTFEANATLKALAISAIETRDLVVADDSGLEVDALNGAPGVYSARYAGEHASDEDNVRKLLAALSARGAIASEKRAARFRCVLVVARAGEALHVCTGVVQGRIALEPRGDHGFGYDPVFVPTSSKATFAELSDVEKNAISHRARAAAKLREWLTT